LYTTLCSTLFPVLFQYVYSYIPSAVRKGLRHLQLGMQTVTSSLDLTSFGIRTPVGNSNVIAQVFPSVGLPVQCITYLVGFEVFTAVVMKSIIFWDMTPCILLSCNRRFGGTYRLHLQGRRNNVSKNQQVRLRRYVLPKRRLQLNRLHGVISQKIIPFITYLVSERKWTLQNIRKNGYELVFRQFHFSSKSRPSCACFLLGALFLRHKYMFS
jgi:hypothetical protein